MTVEFPTAVRAYIRNSFHMTKDEAPSGNQEWPHGGVWADGNNRVNRACHSHQFHIPAFFAHAAKAPAVMWEVRK